MARYIDISNIHIPKGFFNDLNVPKLLDWLHSLPTADVQEVKHGKWECVNIDYDVQYVNIVTMRCPICKRWHSEIYFYGNPVENVNYCPHCGAKMDKGE